MTKENKLGGKKWWGKKSVVWFDMSSLPICLGCGITAQSLALLTKNDVQRVFGAVWWHRVDTIPPTPPAWEELKRPVFPLLEKNHHVRISGFCRLTETSIITRGRKFRAFMVFCFYIYIDLYLYIYICTHTQIHTKTSTQTRVQDWSRGSQTSHLYLLAYLFTAEGGDW